MDGEISILFKCFFGELNSLKSILPLASADFADVILRKIKMEIFEKKDMTIGEKYGPAMKITSRKKAKEYLYECIEHTMRFFNKTRKEAREIELSNLGYYSGYCDIDTRKRVEYLFGCVHPVFGPAKNKEITPEEAFDLGIKMSKGDLELINQPEEPKEINRFNSLEIK